MTDTNLSVDDRLDRIESAIRSLTYGVGRFKALSYGEHPELAQINRGERPHERTIPRPETRPLATDDQETRSDA